MSIYNKSFGAFGEQMAAEYLEKKKYKIIERNYSVRPGEIDIIASKNDYIIFVEVKTRKDDLFSRPSEAVTYYKKRNFVNAAKIFIMQNKTKNPLRFDVLEVYLNVAADKYTLREIRHIENAFNVKRGVI